jgi:predicted nuclease of restriction endonuclease-like (RecB) superfamily
MGDITTILSNNEEYKQLINSLLQRIKQTRMQTAIGVNSQLIKLYWSIGRDIVKMQENNAYGDALVYQLSEDLQRAFPDVKGFSYRNLHYMKNMYLTFNQLDANLPRVVAESSDANLPQVVAESALDYVALVPWGHIRYLLDKRYTSEKAFFYITQIIEHGWSRNMLLNMLSTDLYESKGVSVNLLVS